MVQVVAITASLVAALVTHVEGISEAATNTQLYPCSAVARQVWRLSTSSNMSTPSTLSLLQKEGEVTLQVQKNNPSNATTCPKASHASCYNLVVAPMNTTTVTTTAAAAAAAAPSLYFILSEGQFRVVNAPSTHGTVTVVSDVIGLCVASDWAGSHGYLPNVFLTECANAEETWQFKQGPSQFHASDAGGGGGSGSWKGIQGHLISTPKSSEDGKPSCLDVGSGGSVGDLGFRLDLAQAAPPGRQAFNSSAYASWGGSVIEDEHGEYHMFMSVFQGHGGLSSWTSQSEIMHAVAATPEGPFTPTTNGPNKDGIVAGPEAHNPTVVRANDGTYLLFSIGKTPLLSAASLSGPWVEAKFTSCNNPAPIVVQGQDQMYVVCHGGPNPQHWGSSVGMVWTEHWKSGVWNVVANNTDDHLDGGKALFNHPVEDPFAWHSATDGHFHILSHGFRMGMVNGTMPGCGNAYGVYARSPTPTGPWSFQEAAIVYNNIIDFVASSSPSLAMDRRERPHLLFDKSGNPTHLYNGVCPAGNVYGEPGTQPNHCFTAVQPLRTP